MRALAGVDAALDAAVGRVHHGDVVAAHVGHQHARRSATARRPACVPTRWSTAPPCVRRSMAASLPVPCSETNTVGAVRREGQVAGHGSQRETLQQAVGAGLVDIDLGAGEAVHHQELAVRAEAELVGVGDRDAAGAARSVAGSSTKNSLPPRIAHQQVAAVRRQRPVVRLAQHRDAAQFAWLARSMTLSVASLEFITSTAPAAPGRASGWRQQRGEQQERWPETAHDGLVRKEIGGWDSGGCSRRIRHLGRVLLPRSAVGTRPAEPAHAHHDPHDFASAAGRFRAHVHRHRQAGKQPLHVLPARMSGAGVHHRGGAAGHAPSGMPRRYCSRGRAPAPARR